MMTSSQEPQRNPERDFGPAAKYSDHPIGDIITYYLGSEVRTGEIIYITAPTQEGSMHHPLTYVETNGPTFCSSENGADTYQACADTS